MTLTTMRPIDALAAAIRDGSLDGYKSGTPPTTRGYLDDIDQLVCDVAECPGCGHVGLQARPFYSKRTGQYRCFQVCQCGMSQEI